MKTAPRTREGETVELPRGVWCDWSSEFNAGPWAGIRPREIRMSYALYSIIYQYRC
jgi:hypothetical protein